MGIVLSSLATKLQRLKIQRLRVKRLNVNSDTKFRGPFAPLRGSVKISFVSRINTTEKVEKMRRSKRDDAVIFRPVFKPDGVIKQRNIVLVHGLARVH